MTSAPHARLRIAAIDFLNPAPLMWDFEHPPLRDPLALRYQIERMSPSECAARLAAGPADPQRADIGLVPIASLAANPNLRILPGCTIAAKGRVRSLLLVRRAAKPLAQLLSVAADTASRTTVAYARILFHHWGNPQVPFLPHSADLDAMLDHADAAILIGDPALLALEEQANRFERTGEELIYHDLAQEWQSVTGLPFVSAVWAIAGLPVPGPFLPVSLDQISEDFLKSRDHGLQNIDTLVEEWSAKLPIPEQTIRAYLTGNIHYILDEDCLEGMRGFFRTAATFGILPEYTLSIPQPLV